MEEGDDVPDVVVDFTTHERTSHLGRIGSLSAPHRGYDALCRDALLDGVLFGETPDGKALIDARPNNATALLKLPHMAIFGAWHTQGTSGGGGAKFGRVVRSEIIGYGAMPAGITASRIDPAGIVKSVPIYQPLSTSAGGTAKPAAGPKNSSSRPNVGWETDPAFAARDGQGKPILYVAKRQAGKESGVASLVNHSTIMPSARSGRATIAGAVHVMDLSLIALRNLKFPESARTPATRERNELARTALAAYALVAMTQRLAAGYHLRSGCDLIALKSLRLEVLGASLEDRAELAIDVDGARSLLRGAVAALRVAGMPWGFNGAVELTPSPQVVEAIRASQGLSDDLETGNL
jgi:CRISPR-associated protein Csb1